MKLTAPQDVLAAVCGWVTGSGAVTRAWLAFTAAEPSHTAVTDASAEALRDASRLSATDATADDHPTRRADPPDASRPPAHATLPLPWEVPA